MNSLGHTHALLATSRVANIPSVVCNVWVGVMAWYHFEGPSVPWISVASVIIAAVCLYISGNFLNDWMDRDWDRRHRPERALPRGLFSPVTYLVTAATLAAIGVFLAASANRSSGIIALCILAFILIYTIWHKRSPWMVIPMGLCRGLLPIMGALGMTAPGSAPEFLSNANSLALLAGGALFFYIAGLSLSARGESNPSGPDSLKLFAYCCLFATASVILPLSQVANTPLSGWFAVTPYLIWLAVCQISLRKPISKYVSALLAGIPWIDCLTLIPLSLGMLAAGAEFIPMVSLAIPPIAFACALALQRLAPAT